MLLQKEHWETKELGEIMTFQIGHDLSADCRQKKAAKSPPLETQKEIFNVFGTLDDKIELIRKMNKMVG